MEWEDDLKKYLKELEKNKPVIICGDFNVAHEEIDLKIEMQRQRKILIMLSQYLKEIDFLIKMRMKEIINQKRLLKNIKKKNNM